MRTQAITMDKHIAVPVEGQRSIEGDGQRPLLLWWERLRSNGHITIVMSVAMVFILAIRNLGSPWGFYRQE